MASAIDISAIKEAELLLAQTNTDLEQEVARRTAQLEQMVLTDHLTGLATDTVQRMVRRVARV